MKKLTNFLIIAVLLLLSAGLFAQDRGLEVKTSGGQTVAQFGEARALVIGESEYQSSTGWRRLPGVKDDVSAVKGLFAEMGFQVETLENKNSRDLRDGITNFLDKYGYNKDARLVIYFAGHGETLTLGTGNKMGYIVPIDAPRPDRNEADFKRAAIDMDQFNNWAKKYDCRHILFIFDSCFAGTVFRSSETPPAIDNMIGQPVRQFITAGTDKQAVPDQSIFRRELEYALRNGLADMNKDGYVSGTELGLYLFDTVSNSSKNAQNPQHGKLQEPNLNKGDFIFAVSKPNLPPRSDPAPVPVTPKAQPEQPMPANMVRIPGGTFTMGSPDNEPGRNSVEIQHSVTVTSFYMGKYEVSQKEYQAVMGKNPSKFKVENRPVENVSWYDAIEFCNALSIKEGLTPAYTIDKTRSDPNNKNENDPYVWVVTWNKNANGYRLPTEAEWEYACRAGTTTPFNTGNNITTMRANYNGNNPYNNNYKGEYRGTTTAVGSFAATPWGLYDMHGNVWEWCWDWYGNYASGAQADPTGAVSGAYRVSRGGSWLNDGQYARSAFRSSLNPSYRYFNFGFRLVRP